MTAQRCLFADGPLDGASVLVAGGAGAVGHYAIELARQAGARVATTVSGPEKAKLAAAAGAELVVNYRDADALDQLRDFSRVMDRIVEVNLPANLDLDLELAGPATTVVTYAATAADPTLPTRRCMTANVRFRFVLLYGVPRPDLRRRRRGGRGGGSRRRPDRAAPAPFCPFRGGRGPRGRRSRSGGQGRRRSGRVTPGCRAGRVALRVEV